MLDVKRLVNLIEENNINQREFAKRVGITEVTISRYVNGSRQPTSEILGKMPEVLDVSADYLLGNTDRKEIKIVTHNVDGYEAVVHMAKDADVKPEVLENFIRFLVQQQDNKK